MTLLELLVKELPNRGGWPQGAVRAYQSEVDGEVYFFNKNEEYTEENNGDDKWYFDSTTTRGAGNGITREQYEAAQKPAWNGEGLPPVGTECESAQPGQINWNKFKVVAVESGSVFGFWYNGTSSALDGDKWLFRQIRTEADRKREEAVAAICVAGGGLPFGTGRKIEGSKHVVGQAWFDVYDAIAAGKIPGVELKK